jgi:hypothetical protein
MAKVSPWIAYYESLPGGQYRMTDANLYALEAAHPDRLLFVDLGGKTQHVVFLDLPFRVAERVASYPANYLRRIPLMDLPGWPPTLTPMGEGPKLPRLRDCRLKGARFSKGNMAGQEAVEFTIEHEGETFKAWHVGCPVPLLKCAVATLNQEGATGMKMVDLQAMRLVGVD